MFREFLKRRAIVKNRGNPIQTRSERVLVAACCAIMIASELTQDNFNIKHLGTLPIWLLIFGLVVSFGIGLSYFRFGMFMICGVVVSMSVAFRLTFVLNEFSPFVIYAVWFCYVTAFVFAGWIANKIGSFPQKRQ